MIRNLVVAVLLLVAPSACTRASASAASSPFVVGRDGETFEEEVALRRAVHGLDGWRLTVEARVLALCPGARVTPRGLDWAETRGEVRGSLVGVAACMRGGALSAETLTLVASTTTDDDAIASARAEGVRDALVALGIDPSRLRVETEIGVPQLERSLSACSVSLRTSATRAPERHAAR